MIFYLVYMLTMDGRNVSLAKASDADGAANLVTVIEHALRAVDASAEVKIARCAEADE